jgi:hypothetical protein
MSRYSPSYKEWSALRQFLYSLILEVYFKNGIDTLMGLINVVPLADAIKDAEDRTGVKCIVVATPGFPVNAQSPVNGFSDKESIKILDDMQKLGATFCLPHQGTTDTMLDKCAREIRQFKSLCKLIRECGTPGNTFKELHQDEIGVSGWF